MISSLVELCLRLWWFVSGSFLLGSSWDRLQHWDQDSRSPELVSSFQGWGNESFNTLSILKFTYPQHRSSGILRRMRDFVFVASFTLLTYAGCSNLSTRTASACCFVCHPISGSVAVASVLSTGTWSYSSFWSCFRRWMFSFWKQLGVVTSLWWVTDSWFRNSADGWCQWSDTFVNTDALNRIGVDFIPTVSVNPVLSVDFFEDFESLTFDVQQSLPQDP